MDTLVKIPQKDPSPGSVAYMRSEQYVVTLGSSSGQGERTDTDVSGVQTAEMSNEQKLWLFWLFFGVFFGDEILPSYVGMIITNHCKDPH